MQFQYFINLQERGEFYADVRDRDGATVFEIVGHDIFEDGFMRHSGDLIGLVDYLQELNIMQENDTLIRRN